MPPPNNRDLRTLIDQHKALTEQITEVSHPSPVISYWRILTEINSAGEEYFARSQVPFMLLRSGGTNRVRPVSGCLWLTYSWQHFLQDHLWRRFLRRMHPRMLYTATSGEPCPIFPGSNSYPHRLGFSQKAFHSTWKSWAWYIPHFLVHLPSLRNKDQQNPDNLRWIRLCVISPPSSNSWFWISGCDDKIAPQC